LSGILPKIKDRRYPLRAAPRRVRPAINVNIDGRGERRIGSFVKKLFGIYFLTSGLP
jgi:hypothetical protein